MKEARYYKKLPGNQVECRACNWYCKIAPDSYGICGVRKNFGGKLFSLIYGRLACAHVDPIEKKPLYHFLPASSIFSIGTLGCNFGCGFCQNWDISQALRKGGSRAVGLEDYGYEFSPEKVVKYCVDRKCPAIAYTYNEPTVFLEYALDCAKIAQKKGVKNVFVTNGYFSTDSLDEIARFVSAANIDLKAFSEKFYQKHCKAKLEPVKDNIRNLFNL